MTDIAPQAASPAVEDACPLSDEDLLKVLSAERGRSQGFGNDSKLTDERQKANEYYRGEMKDVPSLANRSKAVDSTVADAIDAILPDLMEIFTGGDDPATFVPHGPEDEEDAQQETDYVTQVVFQSNNGWITMATALKDAMIEKLGVFAWWWENRPEDTWERFTGKTQGEVAAILQAQGGAQPLLASGRLKAQPSQEQGTEPLYDLEVQSEGPDGRVKICAWPPEDFTVAHDAVLLSEATYCAGRSRPRAQSLIAEGFKRRLIDQLPECAHTDEESERSRDDRDVGYGGTPSKDMRQVEVVEHFVRIPGKDMQLQLWRVRTGADEKVLLSKERVERIQYDVITPDIACHRLIGRSLADVLIELQRIKTALTRGCLDSIYFALTQRNYINMQNADEQTVSDLLNNQPGMPVRGNGPASETIAPLNGPAIRADVFYTGLEYFSVSAEHRTGVQRNAQGMNPDTLHDTAKGAEMLMTAAQKRVRFLARIIAETGLKGLFLGVHALLRQHASKAAVTRLRGKWAQIDPTTWGARNDMTIEIGLGSAGRAQDIANYTRVLEMQERARAHPDTAMLVTPQNTYTAAKALFGKMGIKGAELLITDPATVPPPQLQPHPEVVKAQAKAMGEAAKAQATGQVKSQEIAANADLKEREAGAKLQLEYAKMDRETELQEREIDLQARIGVMKAAMDHQASLARITPGGDVG